MLSSFARYANGIKGSEAFMPEDMKTAPEVVVPDDLKGAAYVAKTCAPAATKLYTAIWTELQK
jgi:spermidine/putrescine transport system substrate-binding protein